MIFTDLLKSIEFWAGYREGDISDDATLKSIATQRLNRRLDRYLGMLGAGSQRAQTDDTNYTNQPFSLFDIVTTQHDYEFLKDEDGNQITDITAILIKIGGATGTFHKIERVTLENDEAELIMSGDTGRKGIPNKFLERNNTLFFDPIPNYNLSEGGKLFYKRAPSYFVVGDTTKEPGLPVQFHEMLAVASAYDILLVNKSNARTQISVTRDELDKWEAEFRTYQELRNPQKNRIIPRVENTR